MYKCHTKLTDQAISLELWKWADQSEIPQRNHNRRSQKNGGKKIAFYYAS